MMYGSWYIKQRRTEFFVILDHFLLFYPLNNPKNKNFQKIKKVPGDIIILHQCTINDNHMMHGSWNMKRDRQIFLSFWTVFCPFTPPNNLNNQNFEKLKKAPRDIIILHKCNKNHDHMQSSPFDACNCTCTCQHMCH